MSIYEETVCDDCAEQKYCRRTSSGVSASNGIAVWICQDCQQAAQLEEQAAVNAEFDCLRYRLTPKGEDALRFANMQKGIAH